MENNPSCVFSSQELYLIACGIHVWGFTQAMRTIAMVFQHLSEANITWDDEEETQDGQTEFMEFPLLLYRRIMASIWVVGPGTREALRGKESTPLQLLSHIPTIYEDYGLPVEMSGRRVI